MSLDRLSSRRLSSRRRFLAIAVSGLVLGAVARAGFGQQGTQFDRVWRIDYKDGKATLTDLPQGLMAGDSKWFGRGMMRRERSQPAIELRIW